VSSINRSISAVAWLVAAGTLWCDGRREGVLFDRLRLWLSDVSGHDVSNSRVTHTEASRNSRRSLVGLSSWADD
jgi:hypothetical protein